MDFYSKLQQLKDLLHPFEKVWQQEVLIDYPDSLTYRPPSWPENYFETLKLVCELPKLSGTPKKILQKKDLNNITLKKEHEINGIFHLFENYIEGQINLIDIGGGQGHLSRLLGEHFNAKATILEQDGDLIRVGKRISPTVYYHQLVVGKDVEQELELIKGHNLLVGLHTCGSLADHQIELAIRSKTNLINVGCCYLKMSHPLFSKEALTLASRGHGKLSESEERTKRRVKEFRYTLHLFLYDHGITKFRGLGNSKLSLYEGEFATYALLNLKKVPNAPKCSAGELNSYFNSESIKRRVDELYRATEFRFQFGRAIEMQILLERALRLQEAGFKTELIEVFDESVSPRNVALVAVNM